MSSTTSSKDTNNYQEAVNDLVNKLLDYDKIKQIMGTRHSNIIKAIKNRKKTISSLDDIESALEGIEDDDYNTYFDKLFMNIIVNSGIYLNNEQFNIINDYSFAINFREEQIPIGQFLSQNQDLVQKNRKRIEKDIKKLGLTSIKNL